MPRPPEESLKGFPKPLGNMTVGQIVETGPRATKFRAGDRVCGHLPIRETHAVDETRAGLLPEGQ